MLMNYQIAKDKKRKAEKAKAEKLAAVAEEVMEAQTENFQKLAEPCPVVENTKGHVKPKGGKIGLTNKV